MVRTRRGQTPPLANPNNTNNMTPETVQTMIDQALLRNPGGGDGSHSSHENNPRNMHTAHDDNYWMYEDALPHDLADSDDEDLINVDDDEGVKKLYYILVRQKK
ncbi:hypothetical protein Tco_0157186 [Tanacetum coccineum]